VLASLIRDRIHVVLGPRGRCFVHPRRFIDIAGGSRQVQCKKRVR
jgi:hypothetical protein